MNKSNVNFEDSFKFNTVDVYRCRTASAYTKQRSRKMNEEMAKANELRLSKEIERPKMVIDDIKLTKPKPASFYITKARDNFINKITPRTSISTEDRSKIFGPLFSTEVVRTSQKIKSKANNNSKTLEAPNQENILPDWLLERPDYQNTVKKLMALDSNIHEIFAIPVGNRTEEEKKALYRWLSSVSFFSKVSADVIRRTCEKLTVQTFKSKEIVIKKGDIGDCMYIIYSGTAEIYLEPGILFNTIETKAVIGEHTLNILKPRTATIIAKEDLVAFKLTKVDNDSILFSIKKFEKQNNAKLLMEIPFFFHWSFLKVQHLSNFLIQKTYEARDVIYDKGDESDTFYIISSGEVKIQAYVELQHINRWPTGSKNWKILEINRKYIVTVSKLKRGNYFGESTLIDQVPRLCRAICKTKTVCLTINKDEFFDIFSVRDLELLQQYSFLSIPNESELEKQLLNEIKEKNMTVTDK